MKNLPKKIYLNTGVESEREEEFNSVDFNDLEGVRWSTEPCDGDFIEYILAAPAIEATEEYASQFQSKWIKIESEADLPTEHGDCIVRLKSGKVKGAAYYAESKRFYTGGNINDNPVTHWMNFPQPPKEN